MAPIPVFDAKASVFFVGGTGTQADKSATCGGCTKTFYNDEGVASDLSKIMGANGAGIVEATGCDCEVGGEQLTKAAAFADAEEGMVAYLSGTDVVAAGRYEIITKHDNNTLSFPAGTFADPPTTSDIVCNIGGAFDSLQNALDDVDADTYSVEIFTNLPETVGTKIDFDGTGGTFAASTFLRIKGFTTLPEDTGRAVCTASACAIGFDFIGGLENVIIENMDLTGFTTGGFYDRTDNNADNIEFVNCIARSGGYGWYMEKSEAVSYRNCIAHTNTMSGFYAAYGGEYESQHFINCIAYGNTREGFFAYNAYGSTLTGCVAYNNGNGGTKYDGFRIQGYRAGDFVVNCVSYNNGKNGFQFDNWAAGAINCISIDNGAYGFNEETTGHSPIKILNCCANGNTDGQFNLIRDVDSSNITTDPTFVNKAAADFRLLPASPCLNTGMATVGNGFTNQGYSSMGVWQQKQSGRRPIKTTGV